VGIRIPDHPLSGRLLRRVRQPIAAPSANTSGRVSPTEARHVMADLNGRIAAILDGGPCLGGIESTVVDVTHPGRAVILRPGLITMPELASALQGAADIMRHEARVDTPVTSSDGALRSPGLLERHYAPAIPLRIIEDRVELDAAEGQRVARIYIGGAGLSQASLADGVFVIPGHPDGAASQLYRVLRDAENLPVNEILIEAPPTGAVWDAIRDRLKRAATPAPRE
jgi:L-threonylcarbamoyladenylate synthase